MKGGDEEKSRGSILKRLYYFAGEMDEAYHDISLTLGVPDSAMKILYAVYADGTRLPLREILRRSGMSKQTANSALRKLEAEGVVLLENETGKTKTVRLTAAGRLFARKTAGRLMKLEEDVFSSWSDSDIAAYAAYEERFLMGLKEKGGKLRQNRVDRKIRMPSDDHDS